MAVRGLHHQLTMSIYYTYLYNYRVCITEAWLHDYVVVSKLLGG